MDDRKKRRQLLLHTIKNVKVDQQAIQNNKKNKLRYIYLAESSGLGVAVHKSISGRFVPNELKVN